MLIRKSTIMACIITTVAVNLAASATAVACGGLFCQQVPIDQAGEQIIFRRDGNQVTAVVLIQYAGLAEDFSWVLPVPGIPELSIGSDLVFAPLELATRPRFNLEITGEPCPSLSPFITPFLTDGIDNDNGADAAPDVVVLQSLSVGPFDVEIVTSDDAEAMAQWLNEHDYDLTDRGRELIAPYVEDGMNFVALRLRQDQGVGDIQPLTLRYESELPMIPIRLTAVAAQPDMGIIVWLLGESRAVPLNYLHVTPNYTRLNWYAGTTNAYATYQTLITAAMDEAGGQGFATDFAGRDLDVLQQLPTVEVLGDELVRLSSIEDDARFVAELARGFVFTQTQVLEVLGRNLPLPVGGDDFIYQIPELLNDTFTAQELADARAAVIIELNDTVIDPLGETLAIFDDAPYMTRLYTTLSPEEMTLDPIFSFNPDLGDQALERHATLDVSCAGSSTRWTLTLGFGTGRDGEVVIEGIGSPPGFVAPVIEQDAIWRTETLSASGPAQIVTQKRFPRAQVTDGDASGGGSRLCGEGVGQCGAGTAGMLLMAMLGLRLIGKRARRREGT